MVEFLLQYKEYIILIIGFIGFLVESFLSIIGFIIVLNKKVQPDVKAFILERLPELINEAEQLYCDGIDKKYFVFDQIQKDLQDRFPSVKFYHLTSFISQSIEKILGTPQKKEVVK